MFRFPQHYKMDMTLEEATVIISRLKDGSLLDGMEWMCKEWEAYARGDQADVFEDDYDFYDTWVYEVNAYNTVFEKMAPLFKEAA